MYPRRWRAIPLQYLMACCYLLYMATFEVRTMIGIGDAENATGRPVGIVFAPDGLLEG